jgi:hypothetical protein
VLKQLELVVKEDAESLQQLQAKVWAREQVAKVDGSRRHL